MLLTRTALCLALLCSLFLLPASLFGQAFYYHTKKSSSLTAAYGKTGKLNYTYQLSHNKQLRLLGAYIRDEYEQNINEITSNIYTVNVQLQHNLIFLKRLFININAGAGWYWLEATTNTNQRATENKPVFTGGVQAEFYLYQNRLAVVGDLDVFYMPFSDVYRVLRSPTVGLALYF